MGGGGVKEEMRERGECNCKLSADASVIGQLYSTFLTCINMYCKCFTTFL